MYTQHVYSTCILNIYTQHEHHHTLHYHDEDVSTVYTLIIIILYEKTSLLINKIGCLGTDKDKADFQ